MIALWFPIGAALALANGLSIEWTVGRLNFRGARSRATGIVVGSAILRMGAAALVLALALRQGVAEGLLAFGGLWLGRWGAVAILSRGGVSRRSRVLGRMEST